ncbi:MAG: CRISPR-associated endonuclease Cas2 [Hungatella sp.]|nr:CRISPR-associated endonuclease Cas2 [Hungatella sp.]
MYIVSYDIASDRLRNRIARTLEGYGRRVQYSVFECELSEKRYKELYEKLLKLTDSMTDGSIRFYPICQNCQKKKLVIGIPEETDNILREDVIVV